ncbi:MAG TPA: VOC family protein [Steroidobacteraceae bacterium]|nr:VOC family protein [Steroidobacteraceae bacterium]
MALTGMEHYLVLTSDLDATRDFYRDALGMTEGFRPLLGFPGYWMYIGTTPVIHIAEWNTYTAHSNGKDIPVTAPAASTGAFDHVAFNAEDFAGVIARLERHGVTPARNLASRSGMRQLFVFDPNGVKIEINFRN